MSSKRLNKVVQSYQNALSELLLFEIKDPRLTGVHIRSVMFTGDLKLARVYFSLDNSLKKEEALRGFKQSSGFIKHALGQKVQMRFIPELEFIYDESEQLNQRVEDIFRKIDEEKFLKSKSNQGNL